ncbi:hypothetical protein M1Q06_03475 [Planococcus sp. 11815]|uniref:hypothetical protein n=1 Tax=Planococcus sp. 11815 TaxID=2939413 RepID=UPI003DA4345C
MNRKIVWFLASLILVSVLFYGLSISANANNLHANLEEHAQAAFDELYRSNSDDKRFSLREIKKIDASESWIALLEASDETTMYAHYELDWLNRFRINTIGTVPGFTYLDIPTNDGTYGVLVGTNDSLRIAQVNLKTLGAAQLEYSFSTASDPYLIEYAKLPDAIQSSAPAAFTFYDNENQVIEE